MPTNTRSPITTQPSRRAGESAEKKVHEETFAWWFALAGGTGVLVGVCLIAWTAHFFNYPHLHWVLTIAALFMCAWTAATIRSNWEPARRQLLGARGGRSVADVLDDLRRERGYHVLHDIPIYKGGRRTPAAPDEQPIANIDHVLIGRAGVFAIETKTRSKPETGPANVRFDGRQILVNGHAPDRDPIQQARRNATDLERIVKQATGKDTPVRPVILFPGWFVDPPRGQDFWLLNPKLLFSWLRVEEGRARGPTEDEAKRIADALSL